MSITEISIGSGETSARQQGTNRLAKPNMEPSSAATHPAVPAQRPTRLLTKPTILTSGVATIQIGLGETSVRQQETKSRTKPRSGASPAAHHPAVPAQRPISDDAKPR